MIKMFLPIAVVVFANVFYNLSTKLTPAQANPFLSLTITYVTAGIISFVMFCATDSPQNLTAELQKLNWTSPVLAFSLVALEVGYIYVYRVGWKIGVGSLVANILLACVLLVIGVVVFRESISPMRIFGIAVCIAGLVMITK